MQYLLYYSLYSIVIHKTLCMHGFTWLRIVSYPRSGSVLFKSFATNMERRQLLSPSKLPPLLCIHHCLIVISAIPLPYGSTLFV